MKFSTIKHLLPIAALLVGSNISAYDFESNGIYYMVGSPTAKTLIVTTGDEGHKYAGDIVIPSSVEHEGETYTVTAIANQTFSYNDNLTSVVVPNTVTSIGDWAFSYCGSLTKAELPETITKYNAGTFWACKKLESVKFGNTLTDIEAYAFGDCDALTTIEIPASVKNIKARAFSDSNNITDVFVDPDNATYKDIDGVLYTKNGLRVLYCPSGKTEVTLSNIVRDIDDNAFFHCFSLKNINVDPENKYYSSIDGILYSKDPTDLLKCPSGRTEITFPESVIRIGQYAFECCAGFEEMIIPDQIKAIGICAFADCYNLKSVVIGNSVSTIGENAFDYCDALTSVQIGESVVSIGNSAFSYCLALTDIVIPDKVTTIGNFAFLECRSLKNITLGESLNLINNNAFANCEEIKYIYSKNANPPMAMYGVFSENVTSNANLYVPIGSTSKYQEMEPWSNFLNIHETDFSGIESVSCGANMDIRIVDGNIKITGAQDCLPVEVYNLNGMPVAKGSTEDIKIQQRGAYIIKVGNISKKVIY